MRVLGTSNRPVSKLGLGMAAIGRPSYLTIGHATDLTGHTTADSLEQWVYKILDRAWLAGIRYFDAARSYGLSEQFLGNWLQKRQIDLQGCTIGSKWGYVYTGGWKKNAPHHEVKYHELNLLTQQWPETMGFLSSSLGLYQLHSATTDTGVLENNAILKAFGELREHGITLGLSVSGTSQREVIEQALRIELDGVRLFDTVQATYNLFEQDCGSILEAAHKEGVGIIIKEALANGRLTHRNHFAHDQPQIDSLRQIAQNLEVTEDALALAFILEKPWVDTVLSGAAAPWQLESNLKAFDVLPFSLATQESLQQLKQQPEQYWNTRKLLPWN